MRSRNLVTTLGYGHLLLSNYEGSLFFMPYCTPSSIPTRPGIMYQYPQSAATLSGLYYSGVVLISFSLRLSIVTMSVKVSAKKMLKT